MERNRPSANRRWHKHTKLGLSAQRPKIYWTYWLREVYRVRRRAGGGHTVDWTRGIRLMVFKGDLTVRWWHDVCLCRSSHCYPSLTLWCGDVWLRVTLAGPSRTPDIDGGTNTRYSIHFNQLRRTETPRISPTHNNLWWGDIDFWNRLHFFSGNQNWQNSLKC